jgi:hypothetical protein
MSNRYQAGILLPGYNALKVPNPPTIGTATSASGTTVSVTFTAPSCVGGGAISSYQVFACCGARSGFGSSSPVTVSGLTTGQAYTFKALAINAYGPSYPSAASNSVTPVAPGQEIRGRCTGGTRRGPCCSQFDSRAARHALTAVRTTRRTCRSEQTSGIPAHWSFETTWRGLAPRHFPDGCERRPLPCGADRAGREPAAYRTQFGL